MCQYVQICQCANIQICKYANIPIYQYHARITTAVIGDPIQRKMNQFLQFVLFLFCFVFVCLFFWLELAPPHWNFLPKLKTNKQTITKQTSVLCINFDFFFFFHFWYACKKGNVCPREQFWLLWIFPNTPLPNSIQQSPQQKLKNFSPPTKF